MSKVKELREAENIEQRDMAKVIGVSPASYSKKENGIIGMHSIVSIKR